MAISQSINQCIHKSVYQLINWSFTDQSINPLTLNMMNAIECNKCKILLDCFDVTWKQIILLQASH